ncbi:MAG: amino acid permease [Deltaproteobacteria bacterium]|nr:amino acid permease [Deltaproteobacteria bacterium]
MREQLFRRKPVEALLADAGPHAGGLKRVLGAFDLTLLGIGAIIGAGIFVLTGVGASYAGPGLVLSSEFAAMIPVAGSAYSYSYATMGELVAWIIGWDLVLEYAVAAAAVAAGWSHYLTVILDGMGIHLPSALTHAPATVPGAIINLPAVLVVLGITAILYVGVQESARINSVIVGIKLFAVLVVIVVGVFYIKPANWSPFLPLGWGGVVRGAAYIFFAYIGFDAVSTAAEEVIDPQRALPIGILTSLGVCTVLYIAVAAVLTGMVPMHLIDVNAPLATAFVTRGLNFAAGIISVGAVAGLTSVLLVLLLGQSRVFYAISRDGLLPPAFSRVHPKYQTPSIPTVMTGVVVALTAGLVPIKEIAELTNIGTLFAFVLVCMGVWILRHVEPTMRRPFKTPLVPLVPILGAASCILMMLGLDLTTWLRFFIWLGLGFVIYFSYGRFHSVVDAATNDRGRAAMS